MNALDYDKTILLLQKQVTELEQEIGILTIENIELKQQLERLE